MIIICKSCGKNIILIADTIGLKNNYYGDCDCGMQYDVDYNVSHSSGLILA